MPKIRIMDIEYNYTWIYCRYFWLLTWTSLIVQFVHSMEGRGWDKGGGWGIVILASCDYHFIRVHENLVQHPSNNISNIFIDFSWE